MIRRMVKNVRPGWQIELLGGFFRVVDVVAASALKTKIIYLDAFGEKNECILRANEYRPVKIPVISPNRITNDTVQTK